MKNEYVRPLVVFLTVLAITFFTFITINNSFSTYESGQIFEPTDKIYSLVGYRKNSTTEKYYFDIVVEDMNQQLVLLYGFIPDGITVNGNVIVQPAGFNSSQFSSVLVDREWFNIQTNSVTLEFNGKNNPYNQPVYLSSVEGASKWLSAYYMIFAFNIGIVFIMSLYGLSLYLNKPGEDYLFWFSLYTGALTIWSLSSFLMNTKWHFISYLASHAYGWSILLDIIICFKIFKTKLPGKFDKLLSRGGVITILLVWSLLERFMTSNFRDYYYLYFISVGAIIYACAKHRKGAWMLLVGQTISLGMRLVVAFSPLNTMQVSY